MAGGRSCWRELFHAQVLRRLRSIFDTWLTWPHGLRMLRWLRFAIFHAAFVWSKLGEFLSWSFFVFEAGTEKRDVVGSEREIPGRLACEDVLPHGTGIWERPDAVHLRGSLFAWHGHLHSSHRTVLPRGFDEISWNVVRPNLFRPMGFRLHCTHPRPVQAHGCGWSETKTSRRSHRCYSEFNCKWSRSVLYFFCRFSTFSRSELDNLPYFVPFLLYLWHFLVSALNSHFPDPEVRNPRSDVYSGCTWRGHTRVDMRRGKYLNWAFSGFSGFPEKVWCDWRILYIAFPDSAPDSWHGPCCFCVAICPWTGGT